MKVYVSGPIYQSNIKETEAWRKYATHVLEGYGIGVLDPCRNKATYNHGFHTPGEILFRDLKDVDESDLVLVNMNLIGDKLPLGTMAEILYGWEKQKPVVIVHHNDARIKDHPWAIALSVRMFPEIDEALNYIVNFWS